MTVHTIADFAPGGTATALATSGAARWILISVPAGNGAVVRIGDANVSATQGVAVAAITTAGSILLPPLPPTKESNPADSLYQLSQVFAYAASTDKVSVTYGV